MNDIEDDGFVTVYDSAGAPRWRVMGHSRGEGPEKVEGHSAGRTERASDLPVEIEDDGFITVWPERQP